MNRVGLIQTLAVDEDISIDDFHAIARQTDDAFDEVLVIREGVLEYNDIAALQLAVGQHFFVPGAGSAENKFVHQQVIADEQRAFHRGRRNLEGLDDKAGPEER